MEKIYNAATGTFDYVSETAIGAYDFVREEVEACPRMHLVLFGPVGAVVVRRVGQLLNAQKQIEQV